MKEINFDGIDLDIHQRIYAAAGPEQGSLSPCYSREAQLARAAVEMINASGRFKICLKQVVGAAHRDEDWQCEVFTADGIENLATEYHPIEAIAICRAITEANVRLTEY